jgi:hypothetical protein
LAVLQPYVPYKQGYKGKQRQCAEENKQYEQHIPEVHSCQIQDKKRENVQRKKPEIYPHEP